MNCPNKKKKKKKNKKDGEKKKRRFFEKKKNGQAYYVEWDSDASFDFDDSDDEDDKSSKGVAGIAIKKAPYLFSSPHCLMVQGEAKAPPDRPRADLLVFKGGPYASNGRTAVVGYLFLLLSPSPTRAICSPPLSFFLLSKKKRSPLDFFVGVFPGPSESIPGLSANFSIIGPSASH
nr:unnamed protein product [Digitaria exilis]